MKIGIIGAGNIGSVLALHFRRLRHTVLIANSRGPETLLRLRRRQARFLLIFQSQQEELICSSSQFPFFAAGTGPGRTAFCRPGHIQAEKLDCGIASGPRGFAGLMSRRWRGKLKHSSLSN